MKEYDLFIPLFYNDGTPIEAAKLQSLQSALLAEFDGLTFFPQPNKGFWKMAGVVYQDEIVVYRVITSRAASARLFLKRLKAKLKKSLMQEDILIVQRRVKTL